MHKYIVLLVVIFFSVISPTFSAAFPPKGVLLPDYWGEPNVWWNGRASFSGQVIVPACTLAMEDTWQSIDMGETPVRELQNVSAGPEKKFQLRLRNCELAGTGTKVYTGSRIQITFDGLQGKTPDKFSTTGQARGIDLQILDRYGYPVRAGKVIPPVLLDGNEQGLNYTLKIVRNGSFLNPGDYYAALRFKVDYE